MSNDQPESPSQSQLHIYQSADGRIRLDVRFEGSGKEILYRGITNLGVNCSGFLNSSPYMQNQPGGLTEISLGSSE